MFRHSIQDQEIAIRVLADTDYVRNWAKGELKAFGQDVDSPASQQFILRKSREVAERIIKNRMKTKKN